MKEIKNSYTYEDDPYASEDDFKFYFPRQKKSTIKMILKKIFKKQKGE